MSETKSKKSLAAEYGYMPDETTFKRGLAARNRLGTFGRLFYYASFIIAVVALVTLFFNVLNEVIGTVAVQEEVKPETLTDGRSLDTLSGAELAQILVDNLGDRLIVIIRDNISQVAPDVYQDTPLSDVFPNYPAEYADATMRDIRALPDEERKRVLAEILERNLAPATLEQLIEQDIVQLQVVGSWPLVDTLFNYAAIEAEAAADYPEARLIRFYSWLNGEFLTQPMSSVPALAGIRTAILGSLFMMLLVVLVALPIGVGAAIYLQEYAGTSLANRVIETNVRNLAGVPSIIYGMLGLTIFVRILGPVTGGQIFGYNLPDQSPVALVSLVREALTGSDFNAEERSALLDAVRGVNVDEANQIIAAAFGTTPLDEAEVTRLIGLFRSYREVNFTTLGSLGAPSDDMVKNSIAQAIDTSKLNADQLAALEDALQQYGSFTVNGRTILSAALTLVLLILPLIIINGQEALRAVPYTIREASYGLGATKWQTIWRTVLPAAVPGILTGTILAVSRAVGETAPLVVVGAATLILVDPSSPFSKFTALPIQVYQWTARPQDQFRDIAAAAIIVLLILMLLLNGLAIFLRNRYTIRY